jgi:hypothetical protein
MRARTVPSSTTDHATRTEIGRPRCGVHTGSVIGAVAHEELDRPGDLVKQGPDLRSVIDVAVG